MNVRAPTIKGRKPDVCLRNSGSLSWARLEDFKVDLSWELKPRHTPATDENYSKFPISRKWE
jgi:hypothetical protein